MTAQLGFGAAGGGEDRGAVFSECGRYRYVLWRSWNPVAPTAAFVGLNPSTADASVDDPTIRRCKGFARDWGYGGLVMLNLYAFVTSFPGRLALADDPVGPENDEHLRARAASAGIVIAAWGAFKQTGARVSAVLELVGGELHCLRLNRDGSPMHPLYVPKTARPVPYEAARG